MAISPLGWANRTVTTQAVHHANSQSDKAQKITPKEILFWVRKQTPDEWALSQVLP